AEDGIRDFHVTGVQTCALPISRWQPEPPGRERAAVITPRSSGCRAVRNPAGWPGFAPDGPRLLAGTLPFVGRGHVKTLRSRAPRSEERRVGKGRRSRCVADEQK